MTIDNKGDIFDHHTLVSSRLCKVTSLHHLTHYDTPSASTSICPPPLSVYSHQWSCTPVLIDGPTCSTFHPEPNLHISIPNLHCTHSAHTAKSLPPLPLCTHTQVSEMRCSEKKQLESEAVAEPAPFLVGGENCQELSTPSNPCRICDRAM